MLDFVSGTPKRHTLHRGRMFQASLHKAGSIGVDCSSTEEPFNKKSHLGCDMLGIHRTETPKATIMKIGFWGDVHYVVAVVWFRRFRLTGVCVAGPGKVAL